MMILMILVFGLIQRKMHEYAYGEGGRSRIQIYDIDVAVVVHYAGGKNIFTFNPVFIAMPVDIRPVFTLRQLSDAEYLTHALIKTQKLAPVLSILAYSGFHLPGAVSAIPIKAGDVPEWALEHRLSVEPRQIDVKHADTQFSLAGVQVKFWSSHIDGRYHIDQAISQDMWTINNS